MSKIVVLGGDKIKLMNEDLITHEREDDVVIIDEEKLKEDGIILDTLLGYQQFNTEPYTLQRLAEFEDMRYSHLTKKQKEAEISPIRDSRVNPKISRNSPCPCGSGKKYKHCCCK